MEYLRNIVFYHRAKGEHPERKKSIKSSNKTTPQKTGVRSMPVCQSAVLIYLSPCRKAAAEQPASLHISSHNPLIILTSSLEVAGDIWGYFQVFFVPFAGGKHSDTSSIVV